MTVNSLGGAAADGRARTAAWYAPLVPIAISIFAVSALVSYHLRSGAITGTRTMAQGLIVGVYEFFGWVPSCMFFGLVLAWSSIWWVTGSIEQPGKKLLRIGYLTLALAVFGNLDAAAPHSGALGAFLGGGLAYVLGSFLSHVVMAPLTFFALLLATDYFWMSYFERRAYERTQAASPSSSAARSGSTSRHGGLELGVEPAVTEEFKELARILPQREFADASADETLTPQVAGGEGTVDGREVEIAFDRYFAPQEPREPGRDEEAADRGADDGLLLDEAIADGEQVKLSYFERRQLRAAQEAARAAMTEAAGAEVARPVAEEQLDPPAELDFAAALEPDDSVLRGDVVDASEGAPDGDVDVESATPSDEPGEAVVELRAFVPEQTISEDGPREGVAADEVAELPDEGEVRIVGALPRTPVLEETALRAALGFEAAEAREGEPTDTAAAAVGTFEVRAEPLFAAAPVETDLGTADRDSGAAADATPGEREAEDSDRRDTSFAAVFDDERRDDEGSGASSSETDAAAEPFVLAPMPPSERPRGFLAPVRDDDETFDGDRDSEVEREVEVGEATRESSMVDGGGVLAETGSDEPVVAIPRPPEGPRQQSLFVSTVDEALVRDALDVLQQSSRATASMLQRRLRIDYEQAREVLALLAHRGLVDLAEDGSQARRRS